MHTKTQAIRTARKLLRKTGINTICLDQTRHHPDTLTTQQYKDLVHDLILDTYYWET